MKAHHTPELLRALLLLVVATCVSPAEEHPAEEHIVEKHLEEAALSRVKEILRANCFECHSGADARGGVVIFDRESLVQGVEVLAPGDPDASTLYERIVADDESRMPPAGRPPLNAAERELIREWISRGAPELPVDVATTSSSEQQGGVGEKYVLQSIRDHIRTVKSEDRQFVRYFSINHLLNGGATRDELETHRRALAKAINHLSREPTLVIPESIDKLADTVFAVDIRRLGWTLKPFKNASNVNLFDLALLEYPYSMLHEDLNEFDDVLTEYIVQSGMIRPIAYVRADWFISTATQSPLYEDFLQLPKTVQALEQELLKVDTKRNIADGVAARSGVAVSGVSRNIRIVERHPIGNGSYWVSYDFSANTGKQNFFRDPVNPKAAGGEMIFSLPNGLQGYFIADSQGRRLRFAPTEIVADRFAGDAVVRNGLSCIRCHDRGMKGFVDTVRSSAEKLPGSAGIAKRRVLDLYPEQETMNNFVKQDRERFLTALHDLFEDESQSEPLIPVTRRFLDGPIHLATASAELGLLSSAGLEHAFLTRQFVNLGLIPLASGNVIRRDMWEEDFGRITAELGLAIPVLPLDGLSRAEFLQHPAQSDITISTNHENNLFTPGDALVITVTNRSAQDMFVELVGSSANGEKVILVKANTRIPAGGALRFPEQASIKVRSGIGTERVTLFACDQEFPAGVVLLGPNVEHRVLHNFYDANDFAKSRKLIFDPSRMIKKELAIETR